MRVGGYVNVKDDEEFKQILDGNTDALKECINRDGFDIDGEAYIPTDGNPGLDLEDDIDFLL